MIRPCGRNFKLLNDPTAAVNGFLMIDKTCNGMRDTAIIPVVLLHFEVRSSKLKQKATEKNKTNRTESRIPIRFRLFSNPFE
jgi:hypothetical protein